MMKYKHYLNFCVLSLLLSTPVQAEEHKNLTEFTLEELNQLKVTSVSRKSESQFRAAAAVTVLSADDIQRSGATNIPDALRLVPGLNVAQIDSNKWAISSRGFNRQFSNKLLVQIDGRSVYTPLFSGVLWDVQDVLLEDVERIEVIRGPGATMWGANAVNGIINIITKRSDKTLDTMVETLYGNQEQGTVSVRHGFQLDDHQFLRVYGKHLRRGESETVSTGVGNNDSWFQNRAGFRYDSDISPTESFTFQGDIYDGNESQIYILPGLTSPGSQDIVDANEDMAGANLLARWKNAPSPEQINQYQVYIDYVERDINNLLGQRRFTFDFDFQQNRTLDERNKMVWGLGYRFFRDHLDDKVLSNGQEYLDYEPEKSNNNLLSAFVQNEYEVVEDTLFFTAGSKFSYNYFTNFEVQPSARFSWHIDDRQTLWGAASRAIRIPTRGERGLSSIAVSTPGGFVRQSANTARNYDSEKVHAFELGYRVKPNNRSLVDAAVFFNDYDDLRTFETGVSGFNIPNTAFELVASNSGKAKNFGFELATNYAVTRNWKLGANYTYLEFQSDTLAGSDDFLLAQKENQSPEQQFSITSRYNLGEDIEIDNALYYVDELSAFNVDDYFRFDARVAWQPSPKIKLTLVGQNLLNADHQESRPSLYSRPAEVGRSVFGKVTLNF